jgi:hypothetical protein
VLASPVVLLEELLRYRRTSIAATSWFRDLKHDRDLCPRVETRLQELLDYYAKYQAIFNNVQGPRDRGSDVILRYNLAIDGAGQEQVAVFQVKSYDDVNEKTYLKNLKSQYFDAQDKYGDNLERYFILVCTDQSRHQRQLAAVGSEMSKGNIRVIEPRYAYTFLKLPSEIFSATADRFLRKEDYVHKEARNEIVGYPVTQLALILHALVAHLDQGFERFVPEELLPKISASLSRTGEILDRDTEDGELATAYMRLEGDVFIRPSAHSPFVELNPTAFPALRCVILDAVVRYGYHGSRLYQYLFESHHRDALGDISE